MVIAVTGANGFVGSRTARRLLEEGHEVVAFGRRGECAVDPHPRLRYRLWDITSGTVDVGAVDAVVHCAGSVTEWGRDEDFHAGNVEGTRNVLDSFAQAQVFIHISTASVYNLSSHKTRVDEDAAVGEPFITGYSRSKALAEQLVARRRGAAVILRPHIVYGPGEAKILPRLLAMRAHRPLLVPGDGRNKVSVTHIDNLVDAIVLALGFRRGHAVFNVADAVNGSVDEVLTELQLAFGLAPRMRHMPLAVAWPAAVASEAVHRTVLRGRAPLLTRFLVSQLAFDFTLDISRAEAQLGYRPRRSYREAFAEMAGRAPVLVRSTAST